MDWTVEIQGRIESWKWTSKLNIGRLQSSLVDRTIVDLILYTLVRLLLGGRRGQRGADWWRLRFVFVGSGWGRLLLVLVGVVAY